MLSVVAQPDPQFQPAWWLYAPLVAALVLAMGFGRDAAAERKLYPLDQVLRAIWLVESSGRLEPPDGDDGKAIGPLQIHRIYWQDAIAHDPSLGVAYQDCRDLVGAVRVMRAYMLRWVPDAWHKGDAEVIARVHNGGPEGMEKKATLGYWGRVKARLEESQ